MSSIFIQIDKPFYFAGDTIQGVVFLYVTQPINAHQITLKFKGWESVRWIQQRTLTQQQAQNIQSHHIWHKKFWVHMQSSDSQDHPGQDQSMKYNYVKSGNHVIQIKRYSGAKNIARFSSVLYNFGGNFVPPGQYSFPFCFKTGQQYPASFMDKSSDNKAKGRIKYQIQAFIRGYNVFTRMIQAKTQIIIRQLSPIKNQKQQMQAHVKSCCCIDQGTTRIRVFFQKNGYGPGEEAKMYCVVDNKQGKTPVERVSVSLKNQITYHSRQNHTRSRTYNIFQNSFSGLGAGQQGQRQQTVKIVNQRNPVNPMDIKPTTSKGRHLKSTYYLQVEAVLGASCTCCSQLPVVRQPVLIFPWAPIQTVFQAPPNWNPEVMPMMNCKMNVEISNPNLQNMNNPYQ